MNVTPTGFPNPPVPAPRVRSAAPPAAAPDASETATAPSRARSLWDLLTSEERDFFAQQEALGPLTYRPGGGAPRDPVAPVGRRIDVRG